MKKTKSVKQFIFTLKSIDIEKVEQRFGIALVSNINIEERPTNTTTLSELAINRNTPEVISFLDESKKTHKCMVTMIDFEKQTEPSKLHYNCFWDKNIIPYNVTPIGCPIKYINTQAVKSYFSEISKDNYTIKENITKHQQKVVTDSKDKRIVLNKKDFYVTDGIFCSFNCCIAYIYDNKHNTLYDQSEVLLLKIYNSIYPKIIPSIDAAPSWRLLKDYGGNLDILQFRESFNKIEYKNYGNINFICQKSICTLFEEKIKF